MKQELRLADYLSHIQEAATYAIAHTQGLDQATFVQDVRTQQAVLFNLVVLGEAAGNVLALDAAFAQSHPEIPWRSMKGLRNRMAHGYFEINLEVVWNTVQIELPKLLVVLSGLTQAARQQNASGPLPDRPTPAE